MTEVEAMSYFFSTTGGVYTDSTQALHTDEWPHNACVACHNVPIDHPTTMPNLAIFNSQTAQYDSVQNASHLCGQCHGTLRFPDTDHRRMDAWLMSKHGHGGQDDVAGELAEEWAGSTPDEVIGEEDCIACHASTAVLLNGGITEAEALNLLFTTDGGVFTQNTVPQNPDMWPEVSCTSCHNQHKPADISYFNSETKEFEVFNSSQELCGQCHGNLRFPDTDHLSYNIAEGTGGMGVPDQTTMPGIQCVDCHMHSGDIDGTNSAMFGGHSWSVFVQEDDGTETASCTSCHTSINANTAHLIIQGWQDEFANLDSIAVVQVHLADSLMGGSPDTTITNLIAEAQFNLAFAEGDESGGVHNHIYTISLLNDAINKANLAITGIDENPTQIPDEFVLYQNYPNPFNPSTNIRFDLPEAAKVQLDVFDITGQKVTTLLNEFESAGSHSIQFDADNLPSGIYFYRLLAGKYQETMKMILLR